jgi:5-deoxy-glucuronate isomerase
MEDIIRCYDNGNKAIVTEKNDVLSLTYFNLLKLEKGQSVEQKVESFETVYVVLSGDCNINVDGKPFTDVGKRKDIWSGNADSVYATTGALVKVTANVDNTEIAVAGGLCKDKYPPFRIKPDDVEMVNVGSNETHTHRRIFHILGKNADGRAGNLLVSELYCDDGNWSGYPPHKHDEERGDTETEFEELYHFRFKPENGFGGQYSFQSDGSSQVFMTRNGDTFILKKGYHPTVTSPGHEEYIFTIIVGKYQRSLAQHFKEEHQHLMNKFPGVQDMIDKFK